MLKKQNVVLASLLMIAAVQSSSAFAGNVSIVSIARGGAGNWQDVTGWPLQVELNRLEDSVPAIITNAGAAFETLSVSKATDLDIATYNSLPLPPPPAGNFRALPGVYRILTGAGKCLDILGAQLNPNQDLIQYNCIFNQVHLNQLFRFYINPNRDIKIQSLHFDPNAGVGMCLTLSPDERTTLGNYKVVQMPCLNNAQWPGSQRWNIRYTGMDSDLSELSVTPIPAANCSFCSTGGRAAEEAELARLQGVQASLTDANACLLRDKDGLLKANGCLEHEKADLVQSNQCLAHDKDCLAAENLALKAQLAQLNSQVASMAIQAGQQRDRIQNQQERITNQEGRINDLQHRNAQLHDTIEDLRKPRPPQGGFMGGHVGGNNGT